MYAHLYPLAPWNSGDVVVTDADLHAGHTEGLLVVRGLYGRIHANRIFPRALPSVSVAGLSGPVPLISSLAPSRIRPKPSCFG